MHLMPDSSIFERRLDAGGFHMTAAIPANRTPTVAAIPVACGAGARDSGCKDGQGERARRVGALTNSAEDDRKLTAPELGCNNGSVYVYFFGGYRSPVASRNQRGGLRDRGSIAVCILALALAVVFLFTNTAFAHEQWILTSEQILELNSKPKPDLYTHWSANNITMIMVFLLFVTGWVRLGYTGARELFPDLQARLASYGNHVPPILRFCLAWVLLSSAFGAEPRFGVAPFTSPTLFAPDLLLRDVGRSWAWLCWAEVVISVVMLFGIYVRFFAAVLIGFTLVGAWLFGSAILAYAGVLIGICIYLVMQGPGSHYLPLPTPRPVGGPRRPQRQGARERLGSYGDDRWNAAPFQYDGRPGRRRKRGRLQCLGSLAELSTAQIYAA